MKKTVGVNSRVLISLIFVILLSITVSVSVAQIEKTLSFYPEILDFGVIREEGGKVTRKVKAVNISSDSTFIISARTSCGCSEAEYPEQILAPGDTAEISITYNPFNRPGQFLKTAKIFTGDERIGNSFKLKGTVIPSRKNLDIAYPDSAGQLRLSSRMISAGNITPGEARPLFVGIYNNSDKTMMLRADTDSTPLEATLASDSIEPFGVSTMTLMLKGRNFSSQTHDFTLKAFIINTANGDTIVTVPVVGSFNQEKNTK